MSTGEPHGSVVPGATEGRSSMHSLVRTMFCRACERAPKSSMLLRPGHHAEDLGATFGVPLSASELTRVTGVPRSSLAGSTAEQAARREAACRFLRSRRNAA